MRMRTAVRRSASSSTVPTCSTPTSLSSASARFTVRVKVHKVGEAQATANSKQEAEKEAAREFMERYG